MTNPPQTPGTHGHTLFPGMQRVFLSLPESYDPETPLPLVLALHWGGPVAPETGRAYLEGLVLPGLGALDALIAAPNRQHDTWTSPEAEGALLDLLDYLGAHYPLDPAKTLLTGYSMGGHGVWHLAARHPGRFAAALPVSAQPDLAALAGDWPLPTYVIHSRQDELFPSHAVETTMRELHENGAPVELVLLEEAGHFDTHLFAPALQGAVPWVQQQWDL